MWDFFETVRRRHSVRRYQTDMPVEEPKLHAILEMAEAAPSAGDLQSYQIFAVRDPELRRRLSSAADGQTFISEAPVCLVFCAEPARAEGEYGERGRTLYAVQDATIAAAYAQLAAVAAGLGSTWVGQFDSAGVSQILAAGEGLIPVALLSLGYAAEFPEPTPRRALDQVVQYR